MCYFGHFLLAKAAYPATACYAKLLNNTFEESDFMNITHSQKVMAILKKKKR